MARSHSVYLVTASLNPIAAFTVKHECRAWLHKQWGGRLPSNVVVQRLKDNPRGGEKPVCVTMAMFDMPKLRSET